MSSCLRSQSRQRNQQMSKIQLFVIILQLWKEKKKEQEFEVMEYMEEEENLGMSLDFLDRL